MNKKNEISPQKLLSEKQVCDVFGIPIKTLQKWRFTGEGPKFAKIGRSVRYRATDIEAFIDARIRNSTSDRGVCAENN